MSIWNAWLNKFSLSWLRKFLQVRGYVPILNIVLCMSSLSRLPIQRGLEIWLPVWLQRTTSHVLVHPSLAERWDAQQHGFSPCPNCEATSCCTINKSAPAPPTACCSSACGSSGSKVRPPKNGHYSGGPKYRLAHRGGGLFWKGSFSKQQHNCQVLWGSYRSSCYKEWESVILQTAAPASSRQQRNRVLVSCRLLEMLTLDM